MKNRAKCKLCQSIIESFHRYDYVTCKCGEISINGGNDILECSAKDFANFLRVDEHDNEILVKVVEKDKPKEPQEIPKPTKKEITDMLENMVKNLESLPQNAMSLPVNHYDLYSFMAVVLSIFKEESNLS